MAYINITKEDIINNNYKIRYVSVSDGIILSYNNSPKKINFNNINNPFSYGYFDDLNINPDYYINNSKEVEDILVQMIQNYKGQNFSICNKSLITNNILKALSNNPNIKSITLGENNNENIYSLSYDDYMLFKDKNKKVKTYAVDSKLENVYDPVITYNVTKKLINNYSYLDLTNYDRIDLNQGLLKEDLDNFKYLDNHHYFLIEDNAIDSTKDIIKALKKNNLECKIIFKPKDKLSFNKKILNEKYDYPNIFVYGYNHVPLDYYKKCERKLDSYIEKTTNLSPLEKYLFVYNLVAKYKKYNENKENPTASRNLYEFLFNDYMVCVGFATLLKELCKRMDIECIDYSVECDISYDDIDYKTVPIPEEKIIQESGHARLKVHIKDEKYGVNGIYIADPTWDNDIEKDLFKHALLTEEKQTQEKRYFVENEYTIWRLLYSAKSIEEFYQIYNIMPRYYDKESFVLSKIVEEYKELDKEFYNLLTSKYYFINDSNFYRQRLSSYKSLDSQDKIDYSFLVEDIANYIVNNNKKQVSGKIIASALYNMYEKTTELMPEKILEKVNGIIQDNFESYDISFPTRYNIYENGDKKEFIKPENPFDISSDDIKNIRKGS